MVARGILRLRVTKGGPWGVQDPGVAMESVLA
jgi:hypothetical protein